ncbi:3-hydroxyacyl-CoA dehydrogenase NAD-binding domain-containing protein [Haliea sp. E1-2-M8]|uniref:3-hydroxyacyl-CoA dehydrogenase family protein n=1 Tax=Haliea sp. E1-2-M8 TaxID=3064706 RepID=UPI00271A3054|nr:3-hydroxyacyl-CoA dehydrogenase NAD-binding domain-containing protein [Haliea sp. E1-2-M8]MDO8863931.1 3-hydroxyacyl-CoA dehydrogenase NAD-binding domain-containing protein [Haliea sp. E1-2-M8]
MKKIRNIVVVGGGFMGAGIAQVFASARYRVSVFEPSGEVRDSLHERVAASLRALGRDDSVAGDIGVTDKLGAAVANADYVTEAVPEKLELKQSVFADLERLAPKTAILASNTSVIPISRITQGLASAHRMIGTHWWNPPYLVPLVEVIPSISTSEETLLETMALLASVGKEPAHVRKDVPGFVANRLQHALWREAIAMVAEGICDAKTLDRCVKNSFGLRLAVLGPLENADMVGLDLTLDIHRTIIPELDRSAGPNPYLQEQVSAGCLGFKSGEGFRTWTAAERDRLREQLNNHLVRAQQARDKPAE